LIVLALDGISTVIKAPSLSRQSKVFVVKYELFEREKVNPPSNNCISYKQGVVGPKIFV
jgi:hypothetical protein